MLFVLLLALIAAAPSVSAPGLLATATEVERVSTAGVRGRVEATVLPFEAAIEVRTPDDRAAAARIVSAPNGVCPERQVRDRVVVLRCRSTRIEVLVVGQGKTRAIEIRSLRGIPVLAADERIQTWWDPASVKLGAACPGNAPASRA